jgi:ribonuclease R
MPKSSKERGVTTPVAPPQDKAKAVRKGAGQAKKAAPEGQVKAVKESRPETQAKGRQQTAQTVKVAAKTRKESAQAETQAAPVAAASESKPVRASKPGKAVAQPAQAAVKPAQTKRGARNVQDVVEAAPEVMAPVVPETPVAVGKGRASKKGTAPAVVVSLAVAEAPILAAAPAKRNRKPAPVPPVPEVEVPVEISLDVPALTPEPVDAGPVKKGRTTKSKVAVKAQPADEAVQPKASKGHKPRAEVLETPATPEPVQAKPAKAPKRGKKAQAAEAEVIAEPSPAQVEAASAEIAPADAHPAQTLVIEQLRKLGRPVHIRDFERSFTRQGREKLAQHRSDLSELMDELVHAGLVIQTRKRTYGLPESMNLVRGRFQASNGGFGFVIPDSGGDDYYIPEGKTMQAWNGDTVLIRPEGRGGRRGDSPAGVVVRVVERSSAQLVGSLEHSHGYAFLKPDDVRNKNRIMLVPEGLEGLPDGARLVTELYWPEDTGEDEVYGQVLKVLGNEDDPETETQAVVIKYGLRDEFPDEVVQEAEAIPAQIPAAALVGRLDLRSYNIFTVDGRDAKDFDDAIHIQPTPEGNFVVGVHIADVSHYVKAGHPLDDEAYARATSVYLPGRVLPMLPEHLSNGVCSLVPDEDRLTLSALIELNIDGDILDVKLAPSVIRSKARLTYDEVQAYSEAVATLPDQARALEGDLHLLLKITSRLRQRRLREGALDFKMREVKVEVGKDGHLELVPVREETARGMIEDLMLLANKVVARALLERNVPALYRIHEEPTLARFQDVSSAIGRLGLAFPGGEPTPQAYQAVLKKVRGTGQETAVNTLLLRSMQQAKYAGENLGHFGLAFEEYLHFTSPIRRYPDLLVHRMLKASLSGELTDREKADVHGKLSEMGRHTSERERTASEAERDLTKYYQAKWAQENLDGVFDGYVSGVIASGLFVALENGVEGRIHISNLEDDYYLYIEEAGILKGKTSGKVFRVGENITIRITQVNPLARQIEFTQESNMDGNDVKPRARRGGERETSKREKLSTMVPSVRAPRPQQDRTAQEEQQQAAPNPGRPAREAGGRELRPPRGSQPADRPAQRGNTGSIGGGKRRIVTLDRPRNEHLRPVNVTVQRMYFGDWTLENMPPEEGQGGGNYRSSGPGGFRGGRPQQGGPARGSDRPAGRGGQGAGQQREARAPRQQAAPAQSSATQSSATQSSAPVSSDGGDNSDASKRRRRRRGRRGGTGGGSAQS